jgi:CRP-like cAMP-binding protein
MKPSKNNLEKYFSFMRKLEIFNGINRNELDKFLANMQIENYIKGEIRHFDPIQHSKLYIVYTGHFKLTNVNIEGMEVVLSLFNKGCVVTPMYFSPHYDVSAEFLSDVTLFNFTEKDVNQFAKKNHQFSNNNTTYLAGCVQDLMIQSTVLQLKTAKERVGWYLVHAKVHETFEIIFPKAVIASYLGITPESFSRALNSLKREGVSIVNKKITLNSGDELCRYCDRVTGSNCALFESKQCTH